ncbi:hypothetical protein ACQ86O_18155 [Serratia sp. L9]|uniref:hypothetical protein n=1 Tax=Serratia sp. L9 TaxID=3423946 RepID=UPI003D67494B
MKWHVIDVLVLNSSSNQYALILNGDPAITLLAQTRSAIAIRPGDILYPVLDAKYCVNRDRSRKIKVTNVTKFCLKQWEWLREKQSNSLHSNKRINSISVTLA